MGPDGWNVDMSGEWMGVLFPWADMGFFYLPVFSFFDLACSQSYSCIACSKLRQYCVLVVSSRCRGPHIVDQCWKWVQCSEDKSDLRGCGDNKREQMRWKKREHEGMRKRTGGRRNNRLWLVDCLWYPMPAIAFSAIIMRSSSSWCYKIWYYFVSELLFLLTNLVD